MQHRERIYRTPISVVEMILAAENEALRRRLLQVETELAAKTKQQDEREGG